MISVAEKTAAYVSNFNVFIAAHVWPDKYYQLSQTHHRISSSIAAVRNKQRLPSNGKCVELCDEIRSDVPFEKVPSSVARILMIFDGMHTHAPAVLSFQFGNHINTIGKHSRLNKQ